jgi:hypothetical protein
VALAVDVSAIPIEYREAVLVQIRHLSDDEIPVLT